MASSWQPACLWLFLLLSCSPGAHGVSDCSAGSLDGVFYPLTLLNAFATPACPGSSVGQTSRRCCGSTFASDFEDPPGICSSSTAGQFLQPFYGGCHHPTTATRSDAVSTATLATLKAALDNLEVHFASASVFPGTKDLDEAASAIETAKTTLASDVTAFSSLDSTLIQSFVDLVSTLTTIDPRVSAANSESAAQVSSSLKQLLDNLSGRARDDVSVTTAQTFNAANTLATILPVRTTMVATTWPGGIDGSITDVIDIQPQVHDGTTFPMAFHFSRYASAEMHSDSGTTVASSVLGFAATDLEAPNSTFTASFDVSDVSPEALVDLMVFVANTLEVSDVNRVTIDSLAASSNSTTAIAVAFSLSSSSRRRAVTSGTVDIVPSCLTWGGTSGWTSSEACSLSHTTGTSVVCECIAFAEVAVSLSSITDASPVKFETAVSGMVGVAFGMLLVTAAAVMMMKSAHFMHMPMLVFGHHCFAVAMAEIVAAVVFSSDTRENCQAEAILLHFLVLAVFTWLMLSGLSFYETYVTDLPFNWEPTHLHYFILGYGIPAFIIMITASSSSDDYTDDRACWIDRDTPLWYSQIIPVFVFANVGLVFLIQTLHIATSDFRTACIVAITCIVLQVMEWWFAYLSLEYEPSLPYQVIFVLFAIAHACLCVVFFFARSNVKEVVSQKVFRNTHDYDDVGTPNMPQVNKRGFSVKQTGKPDSKMQTAYMNVRQKLTGAYAFMRGGREGPSTGAYVDVTEARKKRDDSLKVNTINHRKSVMKKVQARQEREQRIDTMRGKHSLEVNAYDYENDGDIPSPAKTVHVDHRRYTLEGAVSSSSLVDAFNQQTLSPILSGGAGTENSMNPSNSQGDSHWLQPECEANQGDSHWLQPECEANFYPEGSAPPMTSRSLTPPDTSSIQQMSPVEPEPATLAASVNEAAEKAEALDSFPEAPIRRTVFTAGSMNVASSDRRESILYCSDDEQDV